MTVSGRRASSASTYPSARTWVPYMPLVARGRTSHDRSSVAIQRMDRRTSAAVISPRPAPTSTQRRVPRSRHRSASSSASSRVMSKKRNVEAHQSYRPPMSPCQTRSIVFADSSCSPVHRASIWAFRSARRAAPPVCMSGSASRQSPDDSTIARTGSGLLLVRGRQVNHATPARGREVCCVGDFQRFKCVCVRRADAR